MEISNPPFSDLEDSDEEDDDGIEKGEDVK